MILSGRTTRLPFIKELAARHLQQPLHRVRTLSELMPDSLKSPDYENMDKLAVVYGAHRFRFGNPVNFRLNLLNQDSVFHRFIGTVIETPQGLRLNRILVKPHDIQPRTCKLKLPGGATVRIGQAFRKDSGVEILANLVNNTRDEREVEIDLAGDYVVELKRSPHTEGIFLTEWVPGGTADIVDNFNDTGRIDCEPPGFIRDIVWSNQEDWIKGGS